MSQAVKSFFLESLQQKTQAEWDQVVLKLAPAIHPVDPRGDPDLVRFLAP